MANEKISNNLLNLFNHYLSFLVDTIPKLSSSSSELSTFIYNDSSLTFGLPDATNVAALEAGDNGLSYKCYDAAKVIISDKFSLILCKFLANCGLTKC